MRHFANDGRFRLLILWVLLAGACLAAGHILHGLHVPGALFLGPMLVSIVVGITRGGMRVHSLAFRLSQGCVGLVIAQELTWQAMTSLIDSWLMIVLVTVATLVMSCLISWMLIRHGKITAMNAAWGTAPGAASAMIAMGETSGADPRIVASMQYIRVVWVVVAASLISHYASGTTGQLAGRSPQALTLMNYAATAVALVIGSLMGTRVPAGALLGPLIAGSVIQLAGDTLLAVPDAMLCAAYAVIGCYVGLGFDGATLRYVARRLPAMALSASAMILGSAALAASIAKFTGRDFLSIYLATSPGGIDVMAIIALETGSNVSEVVALQTFRLICVAFTAGMMARLLVRFAGEGRAQA